MHSLTQKLSLAGQLASVALAAVIAFVCVPEKASAFGVDLHISEKYETIKAGDRLYYEVSIQYPENTMRKDLRFTYEVSQDGRIIATSKFLKAVENQASFVDYVTIPEGVDSGRYEINLNVTDYGTLDADASASFHVQKEVNKLLIYFFILLAVIVIFFVLVLLQLRKLRLVK